MKERGGEEWERPPLAVPPDWFELGTPAGIQARTSCRGVWVFVCVCVCARKEVGREEGRQIKERERDGRRQRGGVQLLAGSSLSVCGARCTMKTRCTRKKWSAAYFFFFLLRKWDCSCLRPVDDPTRTRCSGDASQWGQKQTDENRFSCLIWEFTFPAVFPQLWAGAADP